MGDVIPISKQGKFNLGPGTAPSNSTANPSNKYVRPREVNTCWACGTHKPIPGEKYCIACVKSGRDNPMIECMYFEECNTMTRRRYKGQQYFICPKHKETQP